MVLGFRRSVPLPGSGSRCSRRQGGRPGFSVPGWPGNRGSCRCRRSASRGPGQSGSGGCALVTGLASGQAVEPRQRASRFIPRSAHPVCSLSPRRATRRDCRRAPRPASRASSVSATVCSPGPSTNLIEVTSAPYVVRTTASGGTRRGRMEISIPGLTPSFPLRPGEAYLFPVTEERSLELPQDR